MFPGSKTTTTHTREYLCLEQKESRYISSPLGYFVFTAGYHPKAKKKKIIEMSSKLWRNSCPFEPMEDIFKTKFECSFQPCPGGVWSDPSCSVLRVLTLMAFSPCAINAHEKQMLGTGSLDRGFWKMWKPIQKKKDWIMKHFLKTKHLCSFLFMKEHKTFASFLVEFYCAV